MNNGESEHTTEETAKYDVILTRIPYKDDNIVNKVAATIGLGWGEASELVDNIPQALKKAVTILEAQSIKDAFSKTDAIIILKYCSQCGGALTEDSKHCSICGTKSKALPLVTSNQPTSSTGNHVAAPSAAQKTPPLGSMYCPRCKSRNLQTIVETNTESKGGGYGAGKGCFGYLLLGPLGLLCGACGSKAKISTTNRTFFVCMDCGNKLREAKELAIQKTQDSKFMFIAFAVLAALGILMLIIGLVLLSLGCFVFAGFSIFGGSTYKKDSEEIQAKQYEAEFYKE